jgi:eukaryotic-like serine/threonine-protein kinase
MTTLRAGTVVGDRFAIEALAGTGGMGQVYRAHDSQTGTQVALKILHPSHPGTEARFAREARLLASLDHPNIVRYLAHSEHPPFYLAMEWLEGEDLGRRLARGPFGVHDTLELGRRLAGALDVAHRRGVIHRDIKPANVFLGGSVTNVKLLDFGIARPLTGTRAMTNTGQVLGTIGYMAPEQAREGGELRAAVDVFALGCVLFESLAGRPAYSGAGLMEVVSKIVLSEPPRVSDHRPEIPEPVDELVLRMMQRRPEDRPTIPSLIAELDGLGRIAFPELGPRQRRIRRRSTPLAITTATQRLTAVVLVRYASFDTRPTIVHEPAHPVVSEARGAMAIAAAHGGRLETVNTGTQLVVLDGAVAATDLAIRAAHCALALREVADVAVAVAIGCGDTAAAGPPELLAARASRLLEPPTARRGLPTHPRHGIWLDETTACLLDTRFVVARDDQLCELRGIRTNDDPAVRLRGAALPMVGRERELSMLRAALDECRAEHVASAVVVTGASGLGKSRLWHELVAATGATPWIARGDVCAPRTAFGLLAQLVEAGIPADLLHGSPLVEIVAAARDPRVAARWDGDLPPAITQTWLELVAGAAADRGPLLIIVDDLQWGDLESVRVLDATLRELRSCSLMVLALGRSELAAAFPQLWRERRVQQVRLAELTPRAAARLVTSALGERASSVDIERLVERTGGNPLELEEMVRIAPDDRIPGSVLALALAQLEQLDPEVRRLLRAAAVFGDVFWAGGVAAVVGADDPQTVEVQLRQLVDRDLLVGVAGLAHADDEALRYRRPALREAAYASFTEADRQVAHRLVGAWLDAIGGDANVIAGHLERGGEPGGAVVWYLWAAEQALQAHRFGEAVTRAERGIACGATDVIRGELLLLQAEAVGWMGQVRDHARLAIEALATVPPGTSAELRAAAELAVAAARACDRVELRRAAAVIASSELGGDATTAAVIALARAVDALVLLDELDLADAIASLLGRATTSFEDDTAVLAAARGWAGLARAHACAASTPPEVDAAALAGALDAAGHPRCAIAVELLAAAGLAELGADAYAIAHAETVVVRAEAFGLVPYAIRARRVMALPLARVGRIADARAALDLVDGDDLLAVGWSRATAAAIALIAGQLDAAIATAREACDNTTLPGSLRADAHATLARALVAAGRLDEAVAAADSGLAIAPGHALAVIARLRQARSAAIEDTGGA